VDDKINVTAVVDVNGTVQERYGYNGFGGVRYMDAGFNPIPASAFDWETLFDSYRYDTDTGLYQVRFRYLHPLLGRWLTRDPVEEKGGINLCGYCGNNSINKIDSLGTFTPREIVVFIGVLFALVEFAKLWHQHCKCDDAAGKWGDAVNVCRAEFDALGENPTYEQITTFCDKYHAGNPSDAIYNCAKINNPDVVKELIKECGKSSAEGMFHGSLPVLL
jgi:RHS repeat-associated protein